MTENITRWSVAEVINEKKVKNLILGIKSYYGSNTTIEIIAYDNICPQYTTKDNSFKIRNL